MNNHHYLYVAFLAVFILGVFASITMDFSDKGECKYGGTADNPVIMVRQPGSNTFIESEFCITINS